MCTRPGVMRQLLNARSFVSHSFPTAAALRCSDGGRRTFKIYTKTGDKGITSLYNGERRAKTDDTFSALGDVDELNSAIGVACAVSPSTKDSLSRRLHMIQSDLLDVGSAIATPLPNSSESKLERTTFEEARVGRLEEWIDEMDQSLPPLKNFILPGGSERASHVHVARSICRRAERSATRLVQDGSIDPVVSRYLNRLSDFLFVSARHANQAQGIPDVVHRKPDSPDIS